MTNTVPATRPGYRVLYHHRTQALDGQRVHIHEIQRALRSLGHDVLEVAPTSGAEVAGLTTRSWHRSLIEAIAGHTPAGAYEVAELAYNAVAYARLSAAIRRYRPDFVYERYALNTFAGVLAAKRFHVPIVLEVNSPLVEEKTRLGTLFFDSIARRIERYVIRQATRTVAVTHVLKNILVSSIGVEANRVIVIQNGVETPRYDMAAEQRDAVRRSLGVAETTVIGAVGFFREWHGIDALLRAFAAVPAARSSAKVLLVGDGPTLADLRELTRTLRIDDRVVFHGAVPHDQVPPLVAAMDIVLIPRAVEYASPLKLFEYMAARKTIVAPRQANLQEVLTDGEDVLFFTPGDEAELQATLARLMSEPALRTTLAANARRTIERDELTWEGNAGRIVRAFEAVRDVNGSRVLSGMTA